MYTDSLKSIHEILTVLKSPISTHHSTFHSNYTEEKHQQQQQESEEPVVIELDYNIDNSAQVDGDNNHDNDSKLSLSELQNDSNTNQYNHSNNQRYGNHVSINNIMEGPGTSILMSSGVKIPNPNRISFRPPHYRNNHGDINTHSNDLSGNDDFFAIKASERSSPQSPYYRSYLLTHDGSDDENEEENKQTHFEGQSIYEDATFRNSIRSTSSNVKHTPSRFGLTTSFDSANSSFSSPIPPPPTTSYHLKSFEISQASNYHDDNDFNKRFIKTPTDKTPIQNHSKIFAVDVDLRNTPSPMPQGNIPQPIFLPHPSQGHYQSQISSNDYIDALNQSHFDDVHRAFVIRSNRTDNIHQFLQRRALYRLLSFTTSHQLVALKQLQWHPPALQQYGVIYTHHFQHFISILQNQIQSKKHRYKQHRIITQQMVSIQTKIYGMRPWKHFLRKVQRQRDLLQVAMVEHCYTKLARGFTKWKTKVLQRFMNEYSWNTRATSFYTLFRLKKWISKWISKHNQRTQRRKHSIIQSRSEKPKSIATLVLSKEFSQLQHHLETLDTSSTGNQGFLVVPMDLLQ